MYVVGYGCYTAAGKGAHALYQGLLAGRDFCTPIDATGWPAVPLTGARLCRWQETPPGETQKDRLIQALLVSLEEAKSRHPEADKALSSPRLGVIFASTKGCIEDHVWTDQFAGSRDDTLTPVLDGFIAAAGLRPSLSLCISNACSSVHGALWLARSWMQQQRADHVLVVAADQAGPFVVNGFSALKTFADTRVTPFAKDRQGIQLGDAAVALLLSSDIPSDMWIADVALESDGFAATRSDQSGTALRHVVERMPRPDLIIAHATGTLANDVVEDHVYGELFGADVPVTCTKWSVGHGLGASGGIDVIAGLEILSHQRVFSIGNTVAADPAFRGRYLVRGSSQDQGRISRVMANTMGFGGMHGSLVLERRENDAAAVAARVVAAKEEVAVYRIVVDPDVKEEPSWAMVVPRWHQLDQVTFAVVEAGSQLAALYPEVWRNKPARIWIAAAGASNGADYDFVRTGSRSPSRFVGTLPSIRSSSLALLMNWQGPVLCLVAGDRTEELTQAEVAAANRADPVPGPEWMISCRPIHADVRSGKSAYEVAFSVYE
jgi:3-oxoacyl-[acyl-carrier-protein] synthase II